MQAKTSDVQTFIQDSFSVLVKTASLKRDAVTF